MSLKRTLWFPLAVALSAVNLFFVARVAGDSAWHALGHGVLALGFGLWAQWLRQGRVERGTAALSAGDRLEQQAAALEDAQAALADQSAQLAELQERVDFAERMLAQARDRTPLGAREKRE
jgi:hypothetical protein